MNPDKLLEGQVSSEEEDYVPGDSDEDDDDDLEYEYDSEYETESSTDSEAGVSILMSYGENPHYVKLPIFNEFMENSTKFMKNSGLTKWTQNLW